MTDTPDHREKKLQSESAADDIRADELVKLTQREAKASGRDHLRDIPVTNHNYWRFRGEGRRRLPRGIKWGIAGLIVVFIAGFVVSYFVVKRQVAVAVSSRAAALAAGVQDLQGLDPRSAADAFSSLGVGSSLSSGFWGSVLSFFGGSGPLRSFTDLSSQLSTLSQNLAAAENDVFSIIPQSVAAGTAPGRSGGVNGPSAFAADLQNIRMALAAIDADTNQLSGAASYFNAGIVGSGESYLGLKTQVESAEHFLDAFVPWFSDTSSTHHILVLFENPSEMRPGGGFLGSYADVSISGGAITNVSIHDIADVDKTFTEKIVPPVPLQVEETAWRPADGNWFFDFPTSASETLALFQQSGMYANSSTVFEGAIAVTPQVLSDLLSVTGLVTLPGASPNAPSTTFTADNLMVQIQKIVQAGQAKSSAGTPTYPKEVLGQLYQAIFQGLASSTSNEKSQILGLALNWIGNRDVMIYSADPDFESFIQESGAAGDEYQLPSNFNGDYLAIVNADINSDKSERYIAQSINYDGAIGSDGTLTDHLIIDRTHNGNQSPYWWYQTTNQDYMQIIVPEGATLDNQSGGIIKNVPAPINYARNGYSTDPLLAAIASGTAQSFTYPGVTSRTDGDKEVFAIWSRTYAGSSTEAVFDYSQHLFAMPADGVQYQFVFERQSGATGNEQIEIDAPIGYVFAENGLASFTYDSTSTPGRLMFTLTLQKLNQ
jgi:hypothetical protein